MVSAQPRLGISGDRFTLDHKPVFLLGVSYFDAAHWHASDLDQLADQGFNLIRIWLDWDERGFFNGQGRLVKGEVLSDLVRHAGSLGLVVDVTILKAGSRFLRENGEQAVFEVVSFLEDQPHVLFDVMNEHDYPSDPTSHAEVGKLIQAARQANPAALVTVSSAGHTGHLLETVKWKVFDWTYWTQSVLNEDNLVAELNLGIDVITPHLDRTRDWYSATGERVRMIKAFLNSRHQNLPVYLQEENRYGLTVSLKSPPEHFRQAAVEARNAGAAGWVFHTEAGFELNRDTFFNRLLPQERAVIELLSALPKANWRLDILDE